MPEIATQEITMYEGETSTFPHSWTEKSTGNPIDITGSTIEFESTESEYNKSATITDAENGKYVLRFIESDTLGKVSKGGCRVIKYLVKHVSSSGDTKYIYRLNLKVVGVYDD